MTLVHFPSPASAALAERPQAHAWPTLAAWIYRATVLFLLLLAGTSARAQQDPGSGGPVPGTPTPDPTAVPIDGGASLLLAGGAAYALNRLRQRRRRVA